MSRGIVCRAGSFKPGDPPPDGYLNWFEWARIQHKAGLYQALTTCCKRWLYPQEKCKCRRRRA